MHGRMRSVSPASKLEMRSASRVTGSAAMYAAEVLRNIQPWTATAITTAATAAATISRHVRLLRML